MIAYAVITHCRLSREKWSALPIDGSATLTIDTSRTVMKNAAQTIASAFQRSGSGSGMRMSPSGFGSFRAPNATGADAIPADGISVGSGGAR